MIGLSGAVRVLLANRPVDFRKGMDGLAMLAAELLTERRERSAPIVAALEEWMRVERARLPGVAPAARRR